MNKNGNTYTIIYATVLVVLVAVILAFVSMSLKDKQQRNVDIETKQSILKSVNLSEGIDAADDKASFVEKLYDKYITESFVVDSKGEKATGDAFSIVLKEQYDVMRLDNPDLSKLRLPVFICTLDNGEKVQIFPVYGPGLWGPIWGYVAIKSDFNTIYGAVFAHKGETPGLGAEIATPVFSNHFIGKEIFDGDKMCSISIVKGGATPGNTHEVDAISGGTITSHALQKTIAMWLNYYLPYIEKQKNL